MKQISDSFLATRSCSGINADALRIIPYATLVRALVSCFMLLSIGTASLSSAYKADHWNDIFMSACLLSILAVLGYALAIFCLCGLLDLSGRFRTAQMILVIEVIVCCLAILMRAEEIYQNTYGHQQAAMAVEVANNILYVTEQMLNGAAMYTFMKGLAEVLNNKVSNNPNSNVENSKLAGCVGHLGAVYLASVIILNIAVPLVFARGTVVGTYFLLASMLVWTLLEVMMFFAQRKAAILIWQDHCDRSGHEGVDAGQSAYKKGRG